jgi:outer membrane protein TolC
MKGPPMRRSRSVAVLCLLGAAPALAQPGMERLTFEAAIERAVTRHPTVEQAGAGILRAQAIVQQVRSVSFPSVDATVRSTTIGPVPEFGGQTIVPRTQVNAAASLLVPLLTPVRWAERAHARDQVFVAERGAAHVRRQIAVATAQAYLAVIAERRVLESNVRARDTARAHFEYAQQRFEGGVGSRLNALRAQQELSGDEARVEDAQLAVRRAQEALGVLVAEEGPADAAAEPAFDIPAELLPTQVAAPPAASDATAAASAGWLLQRADIRLFNARVSAAERVLSDAWKNYLPEVSGIVSPQVLTPSGLFAPSRSWSGAVLFSVPLFDAGGRRGITRERRALLDTVRAERSLIERQARSEVRIAGEAIRSSERALAQARAAAEQANEVVRITDIAFRTGATTNIEVIDAQRRARDAETAAAVAEDALRRARLELLVAAGRFPG